MVIHILAKVTHLHLTGRACAGSWNPDKESWAYEDFSLTSPIRGHKSYRAAQKNLTTNLRACHQQLSHIDSHPKTDDSVLVVLKKWGFGYGFAINLERNVAFSVVQSLTQTVAYPPEFKCPRQK